MKKPDEASFLEQVAEERATYDSEFAALWNEAQQEIRLARLRKASGLSQAEVAERMGVHQPTVARIEKRPSSVSFGSIRRYIEAIGGALVVVPKENGGEKAS